MELIELLTSEDVSNVKLALSLRKNFTTKEWYEAFLDIYYDEDYSQRRSIYDHWTEQTKKWVGIHCSNSIGINYSSEKMLYYNDYLVICNVRTIELKKYQTKKLLKKILDSFEEYLNSLS